MLVTQGSNYSDPTACQAPSAQANELPSVEVLEDYVSLSGAWASRGFCELVHRWIGRQVVSQGASNKDVAVRCS